MALPSSPKTLSSVRRSRLPYKTSKFVEQNASSSHLNQWTAVDEKLTQTNDGHDDGHKTNKWWRSATISWDRQSWWPTEILHFVVSAALVIGIVVLLLQYDGTALSDWPYNITINTLASVIITLAAVFMVGPLNSCIAQQRWNRFLKRRQLYGFHRISRAKNPIGALRLLLAFQGGPLALFGAAMVVLNLLVGPFVQQLIHTEVGSKVQLGFPSMPIVRKYGGPDATDKSIESGVGFPMRNAFFQAFYSPAATFHVVPTCPNAVHCEWDDYTTLKFCSSCMDMTSSVTAGKNDPGASNDGSNTWSMPGGVTLNDSGSNATKFIATTMIRQADFPFDLTSPTSVLTLAIMGQLRNNDNSIKAAACQIAYCTQQYTGNFSNGGLIELPQGAPRLEFDDGGNQYGDYGNYAVYGNATNTIKNMFHRLMELKVQSNADSRVSSDEEYSNGYVVPLSADLPEHGRILQNAFLNPNASSRSGNLTSLMENIAASLSTALRMTTNAKEQVGGVVIDSRVLIRVQWAWIALPAAFYLFTFVLLILSIVQTRIAKFGIWKDNELVLLFHGLEPGTQRQDKDLHYVDEMGSAAKDMKVKLTQLHNTWYLVEDKLTTKVYNYPAPHYHSNPVEPDHAEQDIEHEPSLQADYEDSRPLSTTGSLPQLNTNVTGSMDDFEPRDRHSSVSPE